MFPTEEDKEVKAALPSLYIPLHDLYGALLPLFISPTGSPTTTHMGLRDLGCRRFYFAANPKHRLQHEHGSKAMCCYGRASRKRISVSSLKYFSPFYLRGSEVIIHALVILHSFFACYCQTLVNLSNPNQAITQTNRSMQ